MSSALETLKAGGLVAECKQCQAIRAALQALDTLWQKMPHGMLSREPKTGWVDSLTCHACHDRGWVVTDTGAALRDLVIDAAPEEVEVEEIPF